MTRPRYERQKKAPPAVVIDSALLRFRGELMLLIGRETLGVTTGAVAAQDEQEQRSVQEVVDVAGLRQCDFLRTTDRLLREKARPLAELFPKMLAHTLRPNHRTALQAIANWHAREPFPQEPVDDDEAEAVEWTRAVIGLALTLGHESKQDREPHAPGLGVMLAAKQRQYNAEAAKTAPGQIRLLAPAADA